ncbi:Putative aspartic-type endopeptidase opsB [Yarrowia lipolytica]|nr:Putative aspartic-type endopeptidase opsB [Yarrowia lipolytica]
MRCECHGTTLVEYAVNITLGIPGQPFSVQIDTGSSDLWVKSDGSSGAFNKKASSTFQEDVPNGFAIAHGDKTSAIGDWVKDTINIGGVSIDQYSIDQYEFAMATQTNTDPVFGIGYPSNEASYVNNLGNGDQFQYDNLPIRLAKDGFINTPAYSLYLDSLQSQTDSLLFGAVDTSKFTGGLALLPFIKDEPSDPSPREFQVTLASVDINNAGSTTNALGTPRLAVLDSGTTLSLVPRVSSVATKNQVDGFTNINITYNCQGQKIVVPINQLFIPLNDSNGNQLYITINGSDEPAYSFLVGDNGSNSGQSVLGDGFLRSAYVVYDLKNNQAATGQVNYNGGAENLKEIDSNDIPSATAAPSVATWTADNDITSDYATATTQYSAHPSGQSSGNDPFGGDPFGSLGF